jgi:hypothetical protein
LSDCGGYKRGTVLQACRCPASRQDRATHTELGVITRCQSLGRVAHDGTSHCRCTHDPPEANRASSSESDVGNPHFDRPRPRGLEPPALLPGWLLPPPLLPLTDVAGSDRANLAGCGLPDVRRCGCGVDWNGCSTTVFSLCRWKELALRRHETSGSQSSDASHSAELLLLLLCWLPDACSAAAATGVRAAWLACSTAPEAAAPAAHVSEDKLVMRFLGAGQHCASLDA